MRLFVLFCLRLALSLRYRVKVKGLKELRPDRGVLFLANHPAEVDPLILVTLLWRRFRVRPVAADFLLHIPFIQWFVKKIGTIPVPGFDLSSNSFKKRRIERAYETVSTLLKSGKNVMIYPAGILKTSGIEAIGGASGVHELLQRVPNVEIVLIRSTGLWGSSFSKALTGKRPDILKAFIHGIRVILKNLIFFTPRRDVLVEIEEVASDFPRKGEKLEVNRYLEEWFNKNGAEELKLVSFSRWKKELPEVVEKPKETKFSLDQIPKEVQDAVLEEMSKLTHIPVKKLLPEHDLAHDLGMDSLDKSQVAIMLKERFGVTEANSNELTSIRMVMVYAAHLKTSAVTEETASTISSLWGKEKRRPAPTYPECETLIEGFLKKAAEMDKFLAAADLMSGEINYRKLKLGVILFAFYLKNLPGDKIGIMLPASIAVDVAMLACQLAGKTPVMINWTLGKRNLESIVKQTGIQVTLSSWKFLDRLQDVELGPIDDQIVLLEEVRSSFTIKEQIQALLLSRGRAKDIMRAFGALDLKGDDPCVILFTSGTESFPKGVPLSHRNVIANHLAAAELISLTSKDVILGILPPFHSFGFSVTGILPLIAGFRVAYSPNPTNGRQIAYAMEHWRATLFCSAPTFLKTLLRVAKANQLHSLRLVITGAERTPDELYQKLKEVNPDAELVEGYGITECAPILTLNRPGQQSKGVGQPLPGVKIDIVHPESKESVKSGDTGLILASGPNIFSGYLGGNHSPFIEHAGQKWYDTGDLGFLDQEGNLILNGRYKRFVKIGGEMVSLSMIEDELTKVGMKEGWKVSSDLPSFAIVASETGEQKSTIHLFTVCPLTIDEVNSALRQSGMSNLIKVQTVTQLSLIPLLGTGKIDYRKLTEQLTSKT